MFCTLPVYGDSVCGSVAVVGCQAALRSEGHCRGFSEPSQALSVSIAFLRDTPTLPQSRSLMQEAWPLGAPAWRHIIGSVVDKSPNKLS